MMNLDVYSMAMTRQAELERALRRQERLHQTGVTVGPSLVTRLVGLTGRVAHRERAVRLTPTAPISCLTTRSHEPV